MPGNYTVRIGTGGGPGQRGSDTILWHNELSRTILKVRGGGAGGSGTNNKPQDGGCGGGGSSLQEEFGMAANQEFNGTGFNGGAGCACLAGTLLFFFFVQVS